MMSNRNVFRRTMLSNQNPFKRTEVSSSGGWNKSWTGINREQEQIVNRNKSYIREIDYSRCITATAVLHSRISVKLCCTPHIFNCVFAARAGSLIAVSVVGWLRW